MAYDLPKHRIVERRNFIPAFVTEIMAHIQNAGFGAHRKKFVKNTNRRQETGSRIFRIQPRFHRPAVDRQLVLALGNRCIQRRRQRQSEHIARLRRVDHPVVPQPRGGVIGVAFVLVLLADRGLERFGLLGRPRIRIAVDRRQHTRRLFAAHHADPRVGPGEQEARAVSAAAHPVVARAEAAADHHRQLGDAGGGDRGDQLGAVLGDALGLVLAADHERGGQDGCAHAPAPISSRPISIRLISFVPAPMSSSLASLRKRSTGQSVV